MKFFDRVKRAFGYGQVEQKSFWTPWYGQSGNSYDAFGGQQEPSKKQLAKAYDDIAYCCVSMIADDMTRANIRLYIRTATGDRQPKCKTVKVHEKNRERLREKYYQQDIQEVIEYPALDALSNNPFHNRKELIAHTSIDMDTTGNAYVLMQMDARVNKPDGVCFLPSHLMQPKRDENYRIIKWIFNQGMSQIEYEPSEIIHFKYANPMDAYGEGLSPLRAIWGRRQISAKELSYLDNYLSNMGKPDAVLAIKDTINPNEAERLSKEFRHRYQGQGAGGLFVTDGTMNLQPLNFPAKDLAELQLYQALKTSICNAYHIPPDMLELGTSSNRSTREAALYQFAAKCVTPRLEGIVQKLNDRFLPFFSDRLFFEADSVIPEDKEYELQVEQLGLSSGALKRQEWRIKHGYSEEGWAREPLLPSGVMPLDAFDADKQAPAEAEPQAPDRSAQAQAIQALQQAAYAGDLPRDAALAQLRIVYGFKPEEAEALIVAVQGEGGKEQDTPANAAADALRGTVGGSAGVRELQISYYRREIPRDACIANAVIMYGLASHDAELLFPPIAPDAPAALPGNDQPSGQPASPEQTVSQGEQPASPAQTVSQPPEPKPEPKAVTKAALELPDYRQQDSYDCGAAATHSVAAYFGLGESSQEEFLDALGTDKSGTRPENIQAYLESLGLRVNASDKLTLEDLAMSVDNGCPVICCVQKDGTGHYLVVTGVTDQAVFVQDPASGADEIPLEEFAANWHDQADGKSYDHFGICACSNYTKTKALRKQVKLKSPLPLVRALKLFFSQLQKSVTNKAHKSTNLIDWFNSEDWTEKMIAQMRPVLEAYYDHAAKETITTLNLSQSLFSVTQPKLKEGADKMVGVFCQDTLATTKQDLNTAVESLKKEISEGLEVGDVKQAMAERVKRVFNEADNYRAFTIGVTEASRAQHSAAIITAKESGVVSGKTWLLSDDACPLCKPLAGKTVGLDTHFMKDGEGAYADISAPPRHPNCRCTLLMETN